MMARKETTARADKDGMQSKLILVALSCAIGFGLSSVRDWFSAVVEKAETNGANHATIASLAQDLSEQKKAIESMAAMLTSLRDELNRSAGDRYTGSQAALDRSKYAAEMEALRLTDTKHATEIAALKDRVDSLSVTKPVRGATQ